MKTQRTGPYAAWKNGPPADPSWFPIAVWAQEPEVAGDYQKAGVNLYISLHGGPTEEQLAGLRKVGMKTVCGFNEVGKKHMDDPLIVGWMHGDEPDNAHSIAPGWEEELNKREFKVYIDGKYEFGNIMAPVHPKFIQRDYFLLSTIDPTRPVYLNLGLGVSWERAPGKGLRSGKTEDYPEYAKGCDIVSYDIYPVNSAEGALDGRLELMPQGIDRLHKWTDNKKPVWFWVECTQITQGRGRGPSPDETKTQVWMALIHGADGVGYFCHSFGDNFDDRALLNDPDMLAAVTKLNKRITSLAPALNAPAVVQGAAETGKGQALVDYTVRKVGNTTYVFAAGMRKGLSADAVITVPGVTDGASVEVIDENRSLKMEGGKLKDSFKPYEVHLYKIAG